MAIRLVLADDHPITLDGLESLFRREPDFQVLACCRNGEEALQAVREHRPDVLFLDIRMPRQDGLAVLRAMKNEGLPTRVVLLTAGLNEEHVLEAVRLGAAGMVLKEMAPQVLIECARKVHAGERWLEAGSLARALEGLLRREAGAREVAETLTPREIEIVRMVAASLRTHEIADKLCISEGTVKNHLHHIYEKLQVGGRLELTRYAKDRALV